MPEHSRKLYDFLVGIYRQDDVLRTLAPFWIAHQRSANTQRAYARGLRVFEEFAREHGAHPAAVKFADTFRSTWNHTDLGAGQGWGARRDGPDREAVLGRFPANVLSAPSSLFSYLDKVIKAATTG
ncbi:hypothetical protein [Streptomyces sp. NBC_00118]|uniref:hypothetical protein n=1 Tax=unclassified Streptomyces TaxID=2593676 RepID=UPI0032495912